MNLITARAKEAKRGCGGFQCFDVGDAVGANAANAAAAAAAPQAAASSHLHVALSLCANDFVLWERNRLV